MIMYIDLNHKSRSTYTYVINSINLKEQAVQKGLILATNIQKGQKELYNAGETSTHLLSARGSNDDMVMASLLSTNMINVMSQSQ